VLVFAAGLLSITSASAQALPGAVEPGRDRPGPAAPTNPDFDFNIVTPHRSAVPRAVDEVHFKLTDIKITGATTIPADRFRDLYAGLIGKDITLADILNVADKIEAVYRSQGYLLVRAYVPPQRVRDGVFNINVVEGYLSGVAVQGGNRDTQRLVRGYLSDASRERPLELPAIERGLLLTNDIPGVTASGVLKASPDTPGASDLVVDVDQAPVTGGLAVDNRGSHYSGLWTVYADAEFNGLFGADQLALSLNSSPDSLRQAEGSLHYKRVLTDDGLTGSVFGTITHGEPGLVLSAAGIATDSWAAGVRLSYPLIRSRAETLTLEGGFTAQDARVELPGTPDISHDRWRVIDFGGSYLRADSWGVWTTTFDAAQGLDVLDASPNNGHELSRVEGDPDFTKFTGSSRLVLPLFDAFSTALTAQGQYALNRLIAGEQIAFGGTQLGRGYDPGAITGDNGVGGAAELRYDFRFADSYLKALEPYVYTDGAQTWYLQNATPIPKSTLKDESLLSIGGGVRFWLPYNVTGAIEGAQMLRATPGSDLGRKATKVLLDLSVRF
jgi:hemolysin activation/secretion protein